MQKLSALLAVLLLYFGCICVVYLLEFWSPNSLIQLSILLGSIDIYHRAVLRFVSVGRARKGDQSQGRTQSDCSTHGN